MKNALKISLLFIAFTIAFLIIPTLFDWIETGRFEITTEKIAQAITLGITTPLVLLLSKKIKNDYLFVVIALVTMFCVVFVFKYLFSILF